jgi:hypothetical protein
MDRKDALRKIRACLARAEGSSFPEEVARALSQARALMVRFNVDQPELLAAGVAEKDVRSQAKRRPAGYECALASMVAESFGCDTLFKTRPRADNRDIEGLWVFVGAGAGADVAAYTFTVLRRQLAKGRAEYSATKLKRYRKNKLAAADAFCDGWVLAVYRLLNAGPPPAHDMTAVQAYMLTHHAQLGVLKPSERDLPERHSPNLHRHHGYRRGSDARVHTAVAGTAQQALLLL